MYYQQNIITYFLILNDAVILCVSHYIDFIAVLHDFTCIFTVDIKFGPKPCICISIGYNSPGKLWALVKHDPGTNKHTQCELTCSRSLSSAFSPCILLNHNLKKNLLGNLYKIDILHGDWHTYYCFQGVVAPRVRNQAQPVFHTGLTLALV